MSFLIFEIIFSSRIHYKNLKSKIIYEQYFNYIFRQPLFAVLVNENQSIKCSGYFVYEVKICQNLHQRMNVKIYMCSDTLKGKNLGKICATLQWHRPVRYINGRF